MKHDDFFRELKEYTQRGTTVSKLANVAALCYEHTPHLNWLGFYLYDKSTDDSEGRLCLGPFQGKPAVAEIAVGKGVCGRAYETDTLQVVDDVHHCDNHIVCDPNSSSELVIPVHNSEGRVVAVLDVDAPVKSRFDEDCVNFFQEVVRFLESERIY